VLGYTIDPVSKRLVVIPDEAETGAQLLALYLERGSLLAAVREIHHRGWTTKSWTTRKGTHRPGNVWDKAKLRWVLTNVTYAGKTLHHGHILNGEHEAIVDEDTLDRVQELIRENGNGCGGTVRNKHGALLKGLSKCGRCGAAMAHHYTKKGTRLYRYYVCTTAQKQGRAAGPTPSLPAQEIVDFVVQQLRKLACDPDLARQVFEEASRQQQTSIPRLRAERMRLQRKRQHQAQEIKRLMAAIAAAGCPATTASSPDVWPPRASSTRS